MSAAGQDDEGRVSMLVDLTRSDGGSLGEGGGLAVWQIDGDRERLDLEIIDSDDLEACELTRAEVVELRDALTRWLG